MVQLKSALIPLIYRFHLLSFFKRCRKENNFWQAPWKKYMGNRKSLLFRGKFLF